MTREELIRRIQILVPNASLTVWEPEGDYFGEVEPVSICGYRICWLPSNPVPCPAEEDLLAITEEQVREVAQNEEDENLYNRYKNDMMMKGLYLSEKSKNPSITFKSFLKNIQDTLV